MPRRRRLSSFGAYPRLTVRGWLVAAGSVTAIIVAYVVGWRDLLYIGVTLMLLVVLAVVVVSVRGARLRVSRRIAPDPLIAGEEARVGVEVANEGWIPTGPSRWRDGLPGEPGSGPFRPFGPLASRGSNGDRRRAEYRMAVNERGRLSVGPLFLRASDPFGLCLHERAVGGAAEILVLPRMMRLEGGVAAPVAVSDTSMRAALTGRDQDDVIAREYRSGDALRHVDWRATAHRGELMVRQEQRHDDAEAVVVLDNARGHWRHAPAFEWAVSMAASIVAHLAGEGTGVTLVLTVPGREGLSVAGSPREALARLATVSRRSGDRGDYLSALAGLQGDGSSPLFVIAGALGGDEWAELASRREANGRGAAIVVDAGDPPEALGNAGWRCAIVDDPGSDMSAVWRSITRGSAHV